MRTLLNQSRLVVCTYNGTTHLETIAQNIPTLIVWDPTYEELRPDAVPYYTALKEAGIFHTDPQHAAAFIEEIWDNVEDWWTNENTQNARVFFCDRFCKRMPQEISYLAHTLQKICAHNESRS